MGKQIETKLFSLIKIFHRNKKAALLVKWKTYYSLSNLLKSRY